MLAMSLSRIPLYIFSLAMLPMWLNVAIAAEKLAETAIDRIAATVNDDVITASELDEQVKKARRQMLKRKIDMPPENLVRQQVLKQMIIESLQLQMADHIGIKVDDADIDQSIRHIMQSNKLNKTALAKKLKADNLTTEQYRQQIRKQMVIQQLIDREVKRRIFVSEPEINSFLKQQHKNRNDAYHVSHILLPLPEAASPEEITAHLQRARDLVERLRNGAKFTSMAATYSKGHEALNGGELGWRKSGQLPDLFVEALSKMKRGDISDPLRSVNGFHILRLNDIRSGRKSKTVTQTHVRHILVKTNNVMPEAEVRNKIILLRQRLEAGDDFARVAQAHSEDPGSAAKGGDLGWVNPGQTVPAFDKAIKRQKIGELSQPVKSAFGFHLIEVLDRRQQDIGAQLDRAQAREQLGMRKMDDRYQQWLRQLENEAYIQVMIRDAAQ